MSDLYLYTNKVNVVPDPNIKKVNVISDLDTCGTSECYV